MITQFKPRQPPHTKSKLIQRFNVSINSTKTHNETMISHRLNSSKDTISHTHNQTHTDQNTIRYRNHISFLQCRIEQHEATIDKLHCEIDNNFANQSKLNAQIMRLQRENKNMLNSLYGAQNKITEMEQQFNMERLQNSIKKIDHELSMSIGSIGRSKNKCKTNTNMSNYCQDQNPQIMRRKNIKNSMKTSQRLSQCQQPSFKLPYFNTMKIWGQMINIEIKSNLGSTSAVNNLDQQKQKQLQLAIYHLRKQIKQQQKNYEEKLINLSESIKKISKQTEIHQQKQQNQQRNQQQKSNLQQKMNKLLTKLDQKDKQIYQIQQKYQQQLKQAEQIVKVLNVNVREIVEQKNKQIRMLNDRIQELEQELKRRLQIQTTAQMKKQGRKTRQNEQIAQKQRQINKNDQSITLNLNQQQQNNKQANVQVKSINQNINYENQIKILNNELQQFRTILKQKQQIIQQLTDKLTKLQQQLSNITHSVPSTTIPVMPVPDPDIINQLTQQFTLKLSQIKTELQYKNTFLQQQSQKYQNLLQKHKKLQHSNKMIEQQCKINNDKLNQSMQQYKQDKQQLQRSIQRQRGKYIGMVRKLQGDIAEKEYMVNTMTEQMILIKQKLQVDKTENQSQTQPSIIRLAQNQSRINEISQNLLEQNRNNKNMGHQQINLQELKQHFILILKQKQQHANGLQADLQKQRQLATHFQKLSNQYCLELELKQQKNQQISKKLEELYQKIENYQNQIEQNRCQIINLKKSLHEVQQKQAFLRDYMNQLKSAEA